MSFPIKRDPSFLLLRLLRVADILVTYSDQGQPYPETSSNPMKNLDAEDHLPNDSAHPGTKPV